MGAWDHGVGSSDHLPQHGIMGSVLLIICLSIAHASMALPSARRSLGFARKTASARNSSSKLGSPLASRVL